MNGIKNIIYIILLIQITAVVSAQLADTTRYLSEEGYIEKMDGNITFNIELNNEYETFKLKNDQDEILLYPNITTNCCIGFSYRFLSFCYSFAPDFLPGNGDEALKGNTNSFHLNSSLVFRNWFFDAAYSNVKGYYLKNTNEFQIRNDDDPYIQFPDLVYTGISGTAGYSFNQKFSINSLDTQSERQLKSTGSFMPLIRLRYYYINDKSNPTEGGTTQRSDNFEWNLGAGYIYTFVHKENYYITLGITPSVGYIHTKIKTRQNQGDNYTFQNNPVYRWKGRGAIGYDARDFYAGFQITASGLVFKQEHPSIKNYSSRYFYKLYIGLRFEAPPFLKDFVDDVEDLLPDI